MKKTFCVLLFLIPTLVVAQTADVTYNDSLDFAKKQIVSGNYTQAEKTLRNLNGTQNAQEEIGTDIHKAIDSVVFDYLSLNNFEREYILKMLKDRVDSRYNKTIAK